MERTSTPHVIQGPRLLLTMRCSCLASQRAAFSTSISAIGMLCQQSFVGLLLVCGGGRSGGADPPRMPLGPILGHLLGLSDLSFSHVPSDTYITEPKHLAGLILVTTFFLLVRMERLTPPGHRNPGEPRGGT
jgi:hypothetical protein